VLQDTSGRSWRFGVHRITAWSGLEGTSVGDLVQPPCRSRVTYSRLHRTSSRQVLNISREGDSTTPLGSLFSRDLPGRQTRRMMRAAYPAMAADYLSCSSPDAPALGKKPGMGRELLQSTSPFTHTKK